MSPRQSPFRPIPSKDNLISQLSLFDREPTPVWSAWCDGASRGNPGPAAYGAVLCDPAGAVAEEIRQFIGTNTNQVAEYEALIRVLEELSRRGARRAKVFTDSQFVVRQVEGTYRAKDPRMQELLSRVRVQEKKFDRVELVHIARSSHEHNRRADRLANEALDNLKRQPADRRGEASRGGKSELPR